MRDKGPQHFMVGLIGGVLVGLALAVALGAWS
jgi:hypothetical protein